MKITRTANLISALLLSFAGATAHAASISLVPSADPVAEGAMFDIDLVLDASDIEGSETGVFSGVVTIAFNPDQVSFGGFGYAAPSVPIGDAPLVTEGPDNTTITLAFTGAADVGVVGAFSFTTLAVAGSTMNFDFVDLLTGAFANESPTNKPFDIAAENQFGASVNVVPLPASVWLMLSAFGMAVGFVRRRA